LKKTFYAAVVIIAAAACCFSSARTEGEKTPGAPAAEVVAKLIDDFSAPDGASALGTKWKFISDRVHIGKSTGGISVEKSGGMRRLCLRGRVKFVMGNGFIQANLPLKQGDGFFDASQYTGIRLTASGNGEKYYLLAKTAATRMHWQLYRAPFTAPEKPSVVEIPFGDFEKYKVKRELDPAALAGIAIVASDREYRANVCVSRIEFY